MLIHLKVIGTTAGNTCTGLYQFSFDQEEVLVGRGDMVDVRLPHPAVSLVHLRLMCKKGQLMALDLGSANGSWMEGHRLPVRKPVLLTFPAQLTIGPFQVHLSLGALPLQAATQPQDTAAFARQMVLEMLGSPQGPAEVYLEVENGPQRGECLSIPAQCSPLIIGRGEGCALVLNDADASRQHLEVFGQGGAIIARDLQSKNGFEVNGSKCQGTVPLSNGDVVQVGQTRLKVVQGAEHCLQQLLQAAAEEPPEVALLERHSRAGVIEPPSAPPVESLPASIGGEQNPAAEIVEGVMSRPLFQLLLFGVGFLLLGALAALIYLMVF
jgi:pSer/pThr/pTyr-binding forkhead associated (FHA) protein